MMGLLADLRSLMINDAGVVAKVGDRIAWDVQPQSTRLPYVNLQQVGARPHYHFKGASNATPVRVLVKIWAAKALDAEAVFTEIRRAISGQSYGVARAVRLIDGASGFEGDGPDRGFFLSVQYRIERAGGVKHEQRNDGLAVSIQIA
jgi:hypothetical protein